MLERLLNTPEDPVLTIVRVVLGVVMFAHGAQKMLGWFGGYGFHGTMGFFHEQLRIPSALAFLAIIAEFFGSIGLILGLFTRVAALGIAIVMLAAIFTVHLRVGFFSNWFVIRRVKASSIICSPSRSVSSCSPEARVHSRWTTCSTSESGPERRGNRSAFSRRWCAAELIHPPASPDEKQDQDQVRVHRCRYADLYLRNHRISQIEK
jgi:putative oxidoreductase